ncbi:hypothetical protein [Micromonospora carbonacea]|uniref:Uncharacterized protein n=1 Tax=Micromonospora carbonacea TaxID=47853 RepID=A0A7H8XDE9_9ACTN|nr:hypothetical protein [Micromonospora carbonacea]MBB5829755.1 hypothetical protein [Micromonospora carbonacea]QLD22865.1 hypothetical protein HXZ27_00240 [Micromonospora carbonacea]
MARRGWGGSIATAIGVAAGAGAAQLGFGYGLGIINWSASGVGAGEAAWVASLAWATWISATSTIAGAVCAQRLRRPVARGEDPAATGPADAPTDAAPTDDPTTTDVPTTGVPTDTALTDDPATDDPTIDAEPADPEPAAPGPDVVDAADRAAGPEPTDPPRPAAGAVALALAAAVGALVTVLLVAVPARMAEVPGVAAPQAIAAGYAGAGLFLGLLVAVWALRSPAAAANVIATVGWLWLLAVVAVVDGVLAGRGLTTAQLGIWQLSADRPGFWIRDWFYWPGAVLALGSALLIGALAARRAARSAEQRLGAAASGGAGPILVALAYLLVVPGLGTLGREQVSAHLVAPYAVVLGLAGSVLTAALAQRSANRRSARRDRGGPADGPAQPTAGGRGSAGPAALPRQRSAAAGEATATTAPGPARPAGAEADQPA